MDNVVIEYINKGGQGDPAYAHPGDAGLDLRACYHYPEILNGEVVPVNTGIRVAIPNGYVGLVCPRSGLASRGIGVANSPGIIDSGYRGDLKVLVHNFSGRDVEIDEGERIAQLVIVPVVQAELKAVGEFSDSNTSRGTGGFGSTGTN